MRSIIFILLFLILNKIYNQSIQNFVGHNDIIKSLVLSHDEKILASGSKDYNIKLWNIESGFIKNLTGHQADVTALAFSIDDKYLISGDAEGEIRLWNLETGICIKKSKEHISHISSLSFNPKGDLFISSSLDNTLKLWNKNVECLKTYKEHKSYINSVDYSSDNKFFISASADNTIKIWDTSGKLIRNLIGHKEPVYKAVITPDSKIIISASDDNTIKFWNTEGVCIKTFIGYNSNLNYFFLSNDKKKIIVSNRNGKITIKDFESKFHKDFDFKIFPKYVILTKDEKYLITNNSNENFIKIWSLNKECNKTFSPNIDIINRVYLSADSKQIYCNSKTNSLLLDSLGNLINNYGLIENSNILQTYLTVSPTENFIIQGYSNDDIIIYNKKGNLIKKWNTNNLLSNNIQFNKDYTLRINLNKNNLKCIEIYNNDRILINKIYTNTEIKNIIFSNNNNIVCNFKDTIKIYNIEGQTLSIIPLKINATCINFHPKKDLILLANDSLIFMIDLVGNIINKFSTMQYIANYINFNSDGSSIIIGDKIDNIIVEWDLNGQILNVKNGIFGIRSIAISSDEQYIATGNWHKAIQIWDKSGTLIKTFIGHNNGVNSIVFDNQNKKLLSGSGDSLILLWDLEKNDLIKKYKDESWINNLDFSPDGKEFISANGNKLVKLWNISNDTFIKFIGHSENVKYGFGVKSVTFSPNGKFIVSGGMDGTIRLWNKKGECIKIFLGHDYSVNHVNFSNDGSRLISGSSDGTYRIWDLNIECTFCKKYNFN